MADRNVKIGPRVALLGLPGAGKSTVARGVSAALGWRVLSTGEALRQRSELDAQLATDLAAGRLGPEPLVLAIVSAAVQKAGSDGLIIDGFPRHPDQVGDADRILGKWHPVLLELDTRDAVSRLMRRASSGTWPARPEDSPDVLSKRMADSARRLQALVVALGARPISRVSGDLASDDVVSLVVETLRHAPA